LNRRNVNSLVRLPEREGGRIPREIARRVSWDSRLLLFELDPARAHPLERQFAMGIGPYASSMVDAARPFAE